MIRSFLPVGQGAFYCEQFIFNRKRINIIYDCGSSKNEDLIKECIENNFENDEIIDALFISHLDEDHINGLPCLLKHCKIKKIFFPLITDKDNKYLQLYNLIKYENGSSVAADFLKNPYDILNSNSNPELYQVDTGAYIQVRNNSDAQTVLSGDNVAQIIFPDDVKEDKIYEKWLYIPYNFRREDRVKQLQNELNKSFGKNMDNEDLHKIWEKGNGNERKRIKSAYRAVKGSFNTNSMTLYSGMEKCGNRQEISNFKHCKNFCCTSGLKRVGCLYMGDYDASGNDKWKSLTDAYKEYWDSIGCVQIPHHGSQYNYNKELSKIDAYFLISAGMNNRYHHPHNVVIKDLLFNGRVPFIVSENKSSEVHLLIEI